MKIIFLLICLLCFSMLNGCKKTLNSYNGTDNVRLYFESQDRVIFSGWYLYSNPLRKTKWYVRDNKEFDTYLNRLMNEMSIHEIEKLAQNRNKIVRSYAIIALLRKGCHNTLSRYVYQALEDTSLVYVHTFDGGEETSIQNLIFTLISVLSEKSESCIAQKDFQEIEEILLKKFPNSVIADRIKQTK